MFYFIIIKTHLSATLNPRFLPSPTALTSLAELQDNVIRVFTAKINERVETDEAVRHNMLQIKGLKKSLDFCHQEVVDLKNKNATMKM